MIFLVALLLASPVGAQTFSGVASVIDGDTIEIHGERIRIHGVDAPESWQVCLKADSVKYRCGQQSAFALDDFLKARRPVTCHQTERDRYSRVVGRCTAGGKDVAVWLVENGHALDWPRYSSGEYSEAQKRARTSKQGMWQGQFQLPWERRQDKEAAWVGS